MSPERPYYPGRCNYTYIAFVDSDGAFKLGPWGWTAERTGVGAYTVTHNLGHTDYVPIASALAGQDFRQNAAIETVTENAVTIATYDSTQPADMQIQLLILTASQ